MQPTNIELHFETEKKIRQLIPYIHTDSDMNWVTDWFMTMGISLVKLSLEKHPHLSVGDLINITMTDKFN